MRESHLQAFVAVERDPAVAAKGRTATMSLAVRLSSGLQRMYEPVADEHPDRFGYLLMLLDRHASEGRK